MSKKSKEKKSKTLEQKVEIIESLIQTVSKFSIAQFLDEDELNTNKKSVIDNKKEFKINPELFEDITLKSSGLLTKQMKLIKTNKKLIKELNIAINTINDMSLFYIKLCFVIKYLIKFQHLHNNKEKLKNITKLNKSENYNELLKTFVTIVRPKFSDNTNFIL